MRRFILLLTCTIVLAACGGKSDSPVPTPAVVPAPGKAALLLPALNSLCVSGTSATTLQSTVNFTWNSSANADGYQLDIKNLLSGATQTVISTTNQAQVILARNAPYSWSVTSKSSASATTTQSEVWRFYNAGEGITSYAPFAAVLTGPTQGKTITAGTTSVNLTWTGSDVDNDISGYDIYFGTASNPPLFKSNVTEMFLNAVSISANATYYWKVVTKDALGNTSTSDTYQFKVN